MMAVAQGSRQTDLCSGQGLGEYSLILVLIAVVVMAAVALLGQTGILVLWTTAQSMFGG